MKIPNQLIEKYNVPVPRYTSYPPANYFEDSFSENDYIQSLQLSNKENPQNISLYIHIPFCKKLCHYCGCNAHLTRNEENIKSYVSALKKEILMVAQHLNSSRKVSQVHWGGGTPNSLPVEMVEEIMQVIHEQFEFIEKPEIAMECHPVHLNEKYIEKLVASKFNRFSLGIQDFRKEVLDNVNRDASVIPVEDLVKEIKRYPGTGVNLDFIYGLPFQDVESFTETIRRAIEISPDRLVTFSYAHVPWIKKAQKILEKKGLPGAEQKLSMFEAGFKLLTENGYTAIGLDHFARASDELSIARNTRTLHRNFQGYCTRETTGQVYAFGTTGISQLESSYIQNTREIDRYIHSIQHSKFCIEKGYVLSSSEKIIRHVINEIMCNHFVSWEEVASQFLTSKETIKNTIHFETSLLNEFQIDNLITFNSEEIMLTELGKYFVRNIAASLDPNLKSQNKKFSKAL